MSDEQDRRLFALHKTAFSIPNCVGFDRDENPIINGDNVEILPPGPFSGRPPTDPSLIGKKGEAKKHYSFPVGWITDVRLDGDRAGCCAVWDFDLRKSDEQQ